MATHQVNLDALIPREDFEIASEPNLTPSPSQLTQTLAVADLGKDKFIYQVIRKPDFQRETSNWSSQTIVDFIQSFLEGDLIPAIILWRAPQSGDIFVIDGAHRLSALIAWVHDDYGDRDMSRRFYDNIIQPEQEDAANKTRTLVANTVGSFEQIVKAGQYPNTSPPDHVRLARNMSAFAVPLQWVHGDAKKAEESFFKINQKATPIDPTELQIIQCRRKPNAIAARALIRAGVGHKYWSAFPQESQDMIQNLAREVYDMLFTPVLETPIKTLDLPVAGRGYSSASVKLVFEFVNFANGLRTPKAIDELPEDEEGLTTIAYLKKVRNLARRVSGIHPSSLGLHPAVYFYGATGRYQPAAFLATVRFVEDLQQQNKFAQFTSSRKRFEQFLIDHKYFSNQIIGEKGSWTRSLASLLVYYRVLLAQVLLGKDDAEIIDALKAEEQLRMLEKMTLEERKAKGKFSQETKSLTFLRDAISNALICKICGARIHKKSISIDHIERVADGGSSSADNAQLTHPYCNSGYKESLHAKAVKIAEPSL